MGESMLLLVFFFLPEVELEVAELFNWVILALVILSSQ